MPFLQSDPDHRYELTRGETVVGSGAQAGLRLSGLDLAARHFTVSVDAAGRSTVRPHSPQNVVLVNGKQVGQQALALREGDVIAAGVARFVYVEDPSRPHALPAQAAEPAPAYLLDRGARVAYPLARRSVSIGRDASSMVLMHDPTVSRFHADVRTEAGAYVLYSTGATGTRVNGKRVNHPMVLDEGDVIEIAGTELTFTQEALPDGVTVHEWRADAADPELSHRTTQGFDVSEIAERVEHRGRGSRAAMVTLVILAALVAGAFFLLR